MEKIKLPDSCLSGNHDLIEVYCDDGIYYACVVRWCRDCGGVVVDRDCDGRTNAGAEMPIKFPNMAKKLKG